MVASMVASSSQPQREQAQIQTGSKFLRSFRPLAGFVIPVLMATAVLGVTLYQLPDTTIFKLGTGAATDGNAIWRSWIACMFSLWTVLTIASVQQGFRSGAQAGSLTAALLATALLCPVSASVAALMLYVGLSLSLGASPENLIGPILISSALTGGLTWLAVAQIVCPMTTARWANQRAYSSALARLNELEAVTATCKTAQCALCSTQPNGERCPCSNVTTNLKEIDSLLESVGSSGSTGPGWVLAYGYLDVWERLHRAEEFIFRLAPIAYLVTEARHDWLRLRGSTLLYEADLRERLDKAFRSIAHYQERNDLVTSGNPSLDPTSIRAKRPDTNPVTETDLSDPPPMSLLEARAEIEVVRRAINTFRDERWQGLVYMRNHIMGAALALAFGIYALVALAILVRVDWDNIVAAAAIFLIGALVGIFNRLRLAAGSRVLSVDVYGLVTARLIHTPFISGLAALVGVVLIGMVFPSPVGMSGQYQAPHSTQSPTQTPMPGASTAMNALSRSLPESKLAFATLTETDRLPKRSCVDEQHRKVPHLNCLLDLREYQFSIILAAMFGLSPALLVSRINQIAEQYKIDLERTRVTSTRTESE